LNRLMVVVAVLYVGAALGFAGETNAIVRPKNWAKPWKCRHQQFFPVTTNLYRGAQPTAEGVKQLKLLGIRTVINLRAFHSDKDKVAGTV